MGQTPRPSFCWPLRSTEQAMWYEFSLLLAEFVVELVIFLQENALKAYSELIREPRDASAATPAVNEAVASSAVNIGIIMEVWPVIINIHALSSLWCDACACRAKGGCKKP